MFLLCVDVLLVLHCLSGDSITFSTVKQLSFATYKLQLRYVLQLS